MTQPIIAQKWNEWKADLRAHWDRVTEDDWRRIEADREGLLTVLQERYGYSRAEAEREVDDFVASRQRLVDAASARDAVTTGSETLADNGVRAQPGDVLGLDTDGETTSLGDTSEDEDKRRIDALRRGAGR
jgi:uncharacterized protein YjbJ (UPF0337 family)